MRLVAHVFVHNFFVNTLRNTDSLLTGIPLAVFKQNRLIDVSPEGLDCGITLGLTRRHTLQACAGIKLYDFKDFTWEEQKLNLARLCYNLSPRVEAISENEMFIDLSGNNPPTVRMLRSLVENTVPLLGNFVTISLAPSRLLAKAATLTWLAASQCNKKPTISGLSTKGYDNFRLCVVKNKKVKDFIQNLPVEVIWPLNNAVIKQLKLLGLKSFSDISNIPMTMLQQQFGCLASIIMDYSMGIDKTKVPVFQPPDMIFYHAFCESADMLRLREVLKQAAIYLGNELGRQWKSYRELTLSVFFDDYRTEKKTLSFNRGKYDSLSIYYDCINLLNKIVINGNVTELYLAAGRLVVNGYNQMALFEDPRTFNSETIDHKQKLARVCENLAAKYSPGVVTMGKNLTVSRREQMLMFVDPFRS